MKKEMCERCDNHFEVLKEIHVILSVRQDDAYGSYEWFGKACNECCKRLLSRVTV